jgi:hypothetical protein
MATIDDAKLAKKLAKRKLKAEAAAVVTADATPADIQTKAPEKKSKKKRKLAEPEVVQNSEEAPAIAAIDEKPRKKKKKSKIPDGEEQTTASEAADVNDSEGKQKKKKKKERGDKDAVANGVDGPTQKVGCLFDCKHNQVHRR